MKILFIHNVYQQAGGEDVVVKQEIELLRKNGHEVESVYFTNAHKESITAKLKFAFSALYNGDSYKKLLQVIEEFKPDIAHVHNFFFQASPSIFFALKKARVPVVFTLHNFRLVCANALLLRDNAPCELCVKKVAPIDGIKYKCYHNSRVDSTFVTGVSTLHKMLGTWQHKVDRYITLTNFSKGKFVNSSLNLQQESISVKPNFVFDHGTGLEKREDFFLYVGRISTEKGIEVVLKSFANTPECKLVIIGDGPIKPMLEQRYKDAKNIVFLGAKEKKDVLDFMKRCKAVVVPSLCYESALPLTIIEAFSTGTPVVASRLGSIADSILENYNGFLFKAGDADDLRKVIQAFDQLISGNDVYNHARQTYLRGYTPEVNYLLLKTIYDDVKAKCGINE
jgi:glycosyltransferase involved in cell wall biosynthesis